MADSIKYEDWYYKAKVDLKSAKILFEAEESEDDYDYSVVAFHCQQCIEKYLKGFIIKKTGLLVDVAHNLVVLCNKSIEIDNAFRRFYEDCRFVNDFYIEPRYPAELLFIKKYDAGICLKTAEKIHEYIQDLEKMG